MSSSTGAINTAMEIRQLFDKDILRLSQTGRKSNRLLNALEVLKTNPLIKATDLQKKLDVSLPTALSAIDDLLEMNVVVQMDERERGQVYGYESYLRILNEGTMPLVGS